MGSTEQTNASTKKYTKWFTGALIYLFVVNILELRLQDSFFKYLSGCVRKVKHGKGGIAVKGYYVVQFYSIETQESMRHCCLMHGYSFER